MKRKAVFIVVKNDAGALLLLKRSSEHPTRPLEWTLPGGKVDRYGEGRCEGAYWPTDEPSMKAPWYPGGYGESDEEAAFYELEEETGIQAKMLQKVDFVMPSTNFIIVPFFELVVFEGTQLEITFPNREHIDYMWLESPTDLPEHTSDKVKLLIEWMVDQGIWPQLFAV